MKSKRCIWQLYKKPNRKTVQLEPVIHQDYWYFYA